MDARNCFLMLFRTCMEHYFIQVYILVCLLVLLQYIPKRWNIPIRSTWKLFGSRFVWRLEQEMGKFSLSLLRWLGVLTVAGRRLTFKEYELLEQCLTDVQKMLIGMEHDTPGWCLTGNCLNNCYFNRKCVVQHTKSLLTQKMCFCSLTV